jgi:chromosome segregation ATPase
MAFKPLPMAPEVSWSLSSEAYLKASLARSLKQKELSEQNTEIRKACDIGCYAGGCQRVNSLDKENKELREQITILRSNKESLQRSALQCSESIKSAVNKETERLQSANKEMHRALVSSKKTMCVLCEEIDQLKTECKKIQKEADKYKRLYDYHSKSRQALLIDTNKEIEELKVSREYVSRLRHTICPSKKYWIVDVNQKHSEKLKEVVKALGKKHVAKREKLITEKEHFAKRVFELTEEIASLKQVDYSKSQVQSLKLQLAAEKRISQKYARDLQEKDKRQSVLTAM